jgi:AcrR family transcriptional regulator
MATPRRQSNLRSDLVMEKIIEVATDLFMEKGFRATTLQDIASQLGMSRVALYHYLSNKEDLLEPVYIREMQKDLEGLQVVLSGQFSSSEKIKKSIQLFVRRATTRPLDFELSLKQIQDLPEEKRQIITTIQSQVGNLLVEIIRQGVERGDLHSSDPKLDAFAIIGMCLYVKNWYRPDGRLSPEQISETYYNRVMEGLIPC